MREMNLSPVVGRVVPLVWASLLAGVGACAGTVPGPVRADHAGNGGSPDRAVVSVVGFVCPTILDRVYFSEGESAISVAHPDLLEIEVQGHLAARGVKATAYRGDPGLRPIARPLVGCGGL